MISHDDTLMPLDDNDELLLAGIAAAQAEHDPLPAGLLERMRFALSLELMDAELAALQSASPAGVRWCSTAW